MKNQQGTYIAPAPTLQEFGPTQEDINLYATMLDRIEAGDESFTGKPGNFFNPRVNAELTFSRIDAGLGNNTGGGIGVIVNSDVMENGLDERSRYKLAQQRFIAGALGLKVGETRLTQDLIASVDVSLPDKDSLPTLPSRSDDGKFYDEEGTEISTTKADAIYAAYFLVANKETFSQPNAFEDFCRKVVEQAEAGRIEVRDKVDDPKGAMALVRQTARVLGYEVGQYQQGDEAGTFVMTVPDIRKGFDGKNTHFKRK
jgi:hypothetical protein